MSSENANTTSAPESQEPEISNTQGNEGSTTPNNYSNQRHRSGSGSFRNRSNNQSNPRAPKYGSPMNNTHGYAPQQQQQQQYIQPMYYYQQPSYGQPGYEQYYAQFYAQQQYYNQAAQVGQPQVYYNPQTGQFHQYVYPQYAPAEQTMAPAATINATHMMTHMQTMPQQHVQQVHHQHTMQQESTSAPATPYTAVTPASPATQPLATPSTPVVPQAIPAPATPATTQQSLSAPLTPVVAAGSTVAATSTVTPSIQKREKKILSIKSKDGQVKSIDEFKKPASAHTTSSAESTLALSKELENVSLETSSQEVSSPFEPGARTGAVLSSITPSIPENIPVFVPKKPVVVEKIEEAPVEHSFESSSTHVEPVEVHHTPQTETPQATRKLVPGGGMSTSKLNQGPTKIKYDRETLLSLRVMDPIALNPIKELSHYSLIASSSSQASTPHNRGNGNRGNYRNQGDNNQDDGWKRNSLPPEQQNNNNNNNNRKQKHQQNVQRAKKVVEDPLEKLSFEVTALLNKITPVTYEKLSQQFLEFNISNTDMLDRLVALIFEKAIYEPGFNSLYADLCHFLREKDLWKFFIVVKNIEDNLYFWVRDFNFTDDFIGPYFSRSELVSLFNNESVPQADLFNSLPEMKNIPSLKLTNIEYILCKNILIRFGKKESADEWYASYVNFDEISQDKRSSSVFDNDKEAEKNARLDLTFRGRLAHSCEIEFETSVKDENLFDQVDAALKALIANRANMPEDEYYRQEAEIEEKRGKIKRRMLGNIRFVGELYKKKLLNTSTMHDCITTLLGPVNVWKEKNDEQDLELLCNLLKTLGENLQSKAKKSNPEQFEAYFDRMKTLSKDKTLSSKIRFHMEEVISLKENNWQGRKPAPVTPAATTPKAGTANAPAKTGPAAAPSRNSSSGDVRNQFANKNTGSRPAESKPAGGRGQPTNDNRNKKSGSQEKGESNKGNAPSRSQSLTPPPVEEEVIDFSAKELHQRMKNALEEYLENVADLNEFLLTCKESPNTIFGYLIQVIADMNQGKPKNQSKMLGLLEEKDLVELLKANKKVVELSFELYEPLKMLVDTCLDDKGAIEKIAIVAKKLVQGGVLAFASVEAMVARFKQINIELDYNMPEDIESTFNKFLEFIQA